MPATDGTEALASIFGGRVLDAATGGGRFIIYLREHLKDYSEIVGVDVDATAASRFGERFAGDPRIRFMAMDAGRLDFSDGSFDTASIGHSLCEFEHPSRVLRGLVRIVRAGGHLIVAESYRDQHSEPTRNHVLLHDWWVAVDQLAGSSHRKHRRRSSLVRDIEDLGLAELVLVDIPNEQTDPKDPVALAELDALADRYLALARGHKVLQARGRALMERVHDVGFQPATALLAVGRI
jgi:ubiquinone/menaquinone biosynthesis C-methylase UbiE